MIFDFSISKSECINYNSFGNMQKWKIKLIVRHFSVEKIFLVALSSMCALSQTNQDLPHKNVGASKNSVH